MGKGKAPRAMGSPGAAEATKLQCQASGQGVRAQLRRPRHDAWTAEQEQLFFEPLATSCNASEAARVAGVSRAGAYKRKLSDPRFARQWGEAVSLGYAEIEAMMMREILFGSEAEEVMLDGDGAVKSRKIIRKRDMQIAMRLIAHHAAQMARTEGVIVDARPDSEDAKERIGRVLEDIRRRRLAEG